MKLRGESGSMPARMGGAMSGLRGGKSLKTAKKAKPLATPKSAVKVIKKNSDVATKNELERQRIARTQEVKERMKITQQDTPIKKKKVIKINSGMKTK